MLAVRLLVRINAKGHGVDVQEPALATLGQRVAILLVELLEVIGPADGAHIFLVGPIRRLRCDNECAPLLIREVVDVRRPRREVKFRKRLDPNELGRSAGPGGGRMHALIFMRLEVLLVGFIGLRVGIVVMVTSVVLMLGIVIVMLVLGIVSVALLLVVVSVVLLLVVLSVVLVLVVVRTM